MKVGAAFKLRADFNRRSGPDESGPQAEGLPHSKDHYTFSGTMYGARYFRVRY
jgi:hypothetical protein